MGRLEPLVNRLRRQGRHRIPAPAETHAELLPEPDQQIIERAQPFTMTSPLRISALIEAVRYCVRRDIPGDFAECGVWLGGSVVAMILTLQGLGIDDRSIWLYDTFEGMTQPSDVDVSRFDPPAVETWSKSRRTGRRPWGKWFRPERFEEARVRETVLGTGYPAERLHFVKGPVEQTIPQHAPDRLALLRLDTDWYESTRHELVHLYPRLSNGGVLLIDDYGHWEGCRRAVDEYFSADAAPVLLQRIDYTGRLAIKH